MSANCPRTVRLSLLCFEQLNQAGGKNRMSHCSKFNPKIRRCSSGMGHTSNGIKIVCTLTSLTN
jgi:hypothetical protein